ncbi:MAG TPA: ZIP family zinc transporter [Dehalococcoidia bacterium]|nr:ZIP family zinc transporter [Dehalococcoidia bacterium]
MLEAAFWGFFGASSLIIGGVLSFLYDFPRRTVGLILAFGAGVLLSAVAYELVLEALEDSGEATVAIGLLVGALTFFVGDELINQRGGGARKDMSGEVEGEPMSIVLGTLLDGIPESFILGLAFVSGDEVSVAYITAVFISNLPEALGASVGLRARGWSEQSILGLWSGIATLSALSAAIGYLVFSEISSSNGAFVLAFAGGGVLAMLTNTMIPQAYREGGKLVALATVLGFTLSVLMTSLE